MWPICCCENGNKRVLFFAWLYEKCCWRNVNRADTWVNKQEDKGQGKPLFVKPEAFVFAWGKHICRETLKKKKAVELTSWTCQNKMIIQAVGNTFTSLAPVWQQLAERLSILLILHYGKWSWCPHGWTHKMCPSCWTQPGDLKKLLNISY